MIEEKMCQWPNCKRYAVSRVFNSNDTDSAYVCKIHRRAALTNLLRYDKVLRVRGSESKEKVLRPETNPVNIKAAEEAKPKPDWKQKAASQADKKAKVLGDLAQVKPRKR